LLSTTAAAAAATAAAAAAAAATAAATAAADANTAATIPTAATHTLQSEGGRLTEVQALELGALVEKRVAEMKSAVLDETSRAVHRALAAKADTMALNKVLLLCDLIYHKYTGFAYSRSGAVESTLALYLHR
jgi:hypothetical protein